MRADRWPGWFGLLCLAFAPWPSPASPSVPERVEWHGKSYVLLSEPLEQRYPSGSGRPRFRLLPGSDGGAAGRGYTGRWRLEDDRLYLVDIDTWLCGEAGTAEASCRRATLPGLFGATPGKPVFAEWFTGELVLSEAALPPSALARTIRITLKAGKVTRIERVDGAWHAREGS